MNASQVILTSIQAANKMRRMALEIAEKNVHAEKLVLAGIRENGYLIAIKIAAFLKGYFTGSVQTTEIRINKKQPLEIEVGLIKDAAHCTIILIDDVANSGRTMQYAIQPLLQLSPKAIQTLALVERTHKLFPVCIDYTGISVSTTFGENIQVHMENGEVVSATLDK